MFVDFNPRTPCGVRRLNIHADTMVRPISIHAPRAGCDGPDVCKRCGRQSEFNPRTPCGVRPLKPIVRRFNLRFQSTHPVRGATRGECALGRRGRISIHAPRAGCDSVRAAVHPWRGISIHAPRAGCDKKLNARPQIMYDFNPRTPCGVRRENRCAESRIRPISIHAPRAGCDYRDPEGAAADARFQSTHPVRGATNSASFRFMATVFQSTHPVRGATTSCSASCRTITYFNPRTPCGVRPRKTRRSIKEEIFQSTHPVRGATVAGIYPGDLRGISIHAPRAGCDNLRTV